MPLKLLIALGLAALSCGCGVGELDWDLQQEDADSSDSANPAAVEPGKQQVTVKLDNIVIQCVMRKPRVLFVLPTTSLPLPDLPYEERGAFRLTQQISAVARTHREALTRLSARFPLAVATPLALYAVALVGLLG